MIRMYERVAAFVAHQRAMVISLLLYLLGMGSYMASDITVAKYTTIQFTAEWAYLKSVFILFCVLSVCGADQVIVRNFRSWKVLLARSVPLSIIISLMLTFCFFIYDPSNGFLSIWFGVLFLSGTTILFGLFRAQSELVFSQLVNNIWKFFLFIIVTGSIISGSPIFFPYAIFLSVALVYLIIVMALAFGKCKLGSSCCENFEFKMQIRLGSAFMVSQLALAVSLYFDQILLASVGATKSAAIYFSHAAVVLPPLVVLNGFVGFIAGPYIRDNRARVDRLLSAYWIQFCALLLSTGVLAYFLGVLVFPYLSSPNIEQDNYLIAIIVLVGCCRLLYVLPSAYISMVAGVETLSRFVISNVACAAFFLIAFFTLLKFSDDPLFSVAVGGLVSWVLRVSQGLRLIHLDMMIHNRSKAAG